MKRFAVSLISSLLAFTAGLVTASSWIPKTEQIFDHPVVVNGAEPCAPQPPNVLVHSSVTVPHGLDFAEGRFKLVPEQIQLKSESRRYNIDVSYPQIIGPQTPQLRKVNQHLKEEATKLYENSMHPADSNAAAYADSPYTTVNFTYDVNMATASFLSVSFYGYNYGADSDYQAQRSFGLNYDLISGKALKLTDLFKSGSNYLEFISAYCKGELLKKSPLLLNQALAPVPANFENWHVTSNGITFDFLACRVLTCSEGEQTVHIPFSDLQPLLNSDLPGKFQITSP